MQHKAKQQHCGMTRNYCVQRMQRCPDATKQRRNTTSHKAGKAGKTGRAGKAISSALGTTVVYVYLHFLRRNHFLERRVELHDGAELVLGLQGSTHGVLTGLGFSLGFTQLIILLHGTRCIIYCCTATAHDRSGRNGLAGRILHSLHSKKTPLFCSLLIC